MALAIPQYLRSPLYTTSAVAALLVVVATFLHFLAPMRFVFSYPFTLVGAPLLLMGVWLVASARFEFDNRQASLRFGEAQLLITTGPYAKSRNPMYFGGVATLMGIAILLGSLSALIAPIAFFCYVHYFIIPKEEEFMRQKFGEQYEQYAARVDRWL